MSESNSEIVHRRLSDADWQSFRQEGQSFTPLRPLPGGGAIVFSRFAKGVHGGRHTHPGGEDLYVISGRCRVDGVSLAAGDYLHTPPGASHELIADEETVLLLALPQIPTYD